MVPWIYIEFFLIVTTFMEFQGSSGPLLYLWAEELLRTITTFMAAVTTLNETLLMRCNKCITALIVNC